MSSILHRRRPAPPQISATASAAAGLFASFIRRSSHLAAAAVEVGPQRRIERGEWLSLPPFTPPVDAAAIAKEITAQIRVADGAPFTVLKWVRRCCPQLPMSLVQKLFRLRQVRKELTSDSCLETHEQRPKRVSAKDAIVLGDVILLPVTVQKHTLEKCEYSQSEAEVGYIRSLELYKDPTIIVVNKPPGLPVQGGVGIKYSMDALAASSLKYGYSESPRLVHRLDRDSSGILVLGRTQTSATILHSIFREKTSGVLSNNIKDAHRALEKKYWSLVIGTPKQSTGLISVPLVKIALEDGKSERVTIAKNMNSASSQHALTEYKVIKSSPKGYTWLELRPLTGRKHQLRVHCAEVLGTPIVGDYKYGWQAHRKWEAFLVPEHVNELRHSGHSHGQKPPLGIDLEGGSIWEKRPHLHLHCREMGLPDISAAVQRWQSSSSTRDLSDLDRIIISAPLPAHMKTSWDLLSFS